MRMVRENRRGSWIRLVLAAVLAALPACRAAKPPDYQDETGVHFAPPPGWVERDRPALLPRTNRPAHRESNIPLPGFDAAHQERLLVRYDRLTTGDHAWMRLSVAAVPTTTTLERYLATRAPRPDWRREGDVETLEINGKPAARSVWKGRWRNKDYLCEVAAVRRGDEVYFFTASFPATDTAASEEVRQAVAGAVLP
jgi:hypothetical protein